MPTDPSGVPVQKNRHDPAENAFGAQPSQGKMEIEPIAIVGLSIGFPQEGDSLDGFWSLLVEGRSTATEFPKDRLSVSAMYHPDPNRRGQVSVRGGNFIRGDIAAFDAPFFSISSSDAASMDPQQRKLLEYTYRALENAGLPLETTTCSKTAVYIGCFTNDWQEISFKDSERCGTTTALGSQPCVNANRISWFYDFKGNSANIDTACSSSLVALDFGCKDLRNGEANMSIVGGSNLIFSPDMIHSLSNMSMLSPDGNCYSFDHRGTGYGRGEGIGILVLKRLSDALRDRDTIRAIIRNTGCNQDGYTPGITQPNNTAQEALIKATYSRASLSMLPTRYFEAHGTGTPVGDPIECMALGDAFRKTRTSQDPLWVGAVKSNIGHLEGCSGIAAIVKTLLVLEKAHIPPNTNFEQVNPKIDTDYLNIKFPTHSLPWPTTGLRRASVNSFGFAGTNAHAILDDAFHYLQERGLTGHHMTVRDPPTHLFSEAPEVQNFYVDQDQTKSDQQMPMPKVLMFSAHDEKGINRQAAEYASYFARLKIAPDQFRNYLDRLVYTLNNRRTSLTWKSYAVVQALEDLQKLDKIIAPAQRAFSKPALGFVFTGQGAQWAGMGRELIIFPAFDNSLENAEEHLNDIGCPWRLREEIFREDEHSSIDRTDFSQPLCTAIQIAIVDLLHELGVHPTVVIGHSSGEIAAAYSLGAISAKAALKIAYCRGVAAAGLVRSLARHGAMLSVGLSQIDVQPYIDDISVQFGIRDLTIACINSSKNITISGDKLQIESLKSLLDEKMIFARQLLVDVAYHSPHMQDIADEYRLAIQDIEKGSAHSISNAMISSVTGNRVEAAALQVPQYWVSNMVSPVEFSDAIDSLISQSSQEIQHKIDLSHKKKLKINMLVEIGPHSALQGPIRDMLTERRGVSKISYTSILTRKTSGLQTIAAAIGTIKSLGYPVDLRNLNYPKVEDHQMYMTLPTLPEYQFDHSKRYWYESRLSNRFRTGEQGKLDLLGKPVIDWNPLEAKWQNHLRVSEMPWLEDHIINGALVYPGAGMLVSAIEAANQMADQTQVILGFQLKDTQFLRSVNIPQDSLGLETQLSLHLSPETVRSVKDWSQFRLCVYEHDQWQECCRGFIRVEYGADLSEVDQGKEAMEELKKFRKIEAEMAKSCREPTNISALYRNLHKSGFELGPAYQRIQSGKSWKNQQFKGIIRIFEWPESQYPQSHVVHPASLDAIFQAAIAAYTEGGQKTVPTMVPGSLKHIWIKKGGLNYLQNSIAKICVWMTAQDNRGLEFDYSVLDQSESNVLAQVRGMRLTIIAETAIENSDISNQDRPNCYHVAYQPDPDISSVGREQAYCQDQSRVASICRYMNMLAHKRPGQRVLEVNAGSGETLQTLFSNQSDGGGQIEIRFSSYYCTDRSQSVVDSAQKQFVHYPLVTSARLNMEMDPIEQGFEAGVYDILVAHNPFHEYKHIDSILQRIHKLLKVGGKFILNGLIGLESSSKEVLDSSRHWQEIFVDNGFGASEWEIPGAMSESPQDLMVFSSTTAHEGLHTTSIKRVVLVTKAESALQVEISERLVVLLSSKGVTNTRIVDLGDASSMQDKDGVVFIILLEIDQPFIHLMSPETYSVLQQLLISAQDVLWVNSYGVSLLERPENHVINGLARVIRNEYEDHRFTTIAFEMQESMTEARLYRLLQILERNHFNPGSMQNEPEYAEMNGVMNVPRIVQNEGLSQTLQIRSMSQQSSMRTIQDAPPLSLTIGSPGLLDTLHFVEDESFSLSLGDGEVEVKTEAIGLNFKDCLIALGQISGSSFGFECAGVVTRVNQDNDLVPGDRVLMAAQGSFKTFARGPITATCKIPADMPFVDAAAIPAQFGTAWAVFRMAHIREYETVLIHAGAGGTGQALIQIAIFLGATVLATVGSLEKKQLLIREYGILEEHIFDSRNTSFAKGVQRVTKGRGVDVVVNSLVGEGMLASWECIAPYGRFVEIGKRDIMSNSDLPMRSFQKNAAFLGFDMSVFHQERMGEVKRDLKILVKLFADKTFHTPRPLHVYSISDIREVFQLLSNGKSSGKFVLEISPKAQVPATLKTKSGSKLNQNATYVIAGGLGGLGRSTARWMMSQNAQNLILLSRFGASTAIAQAFLEEAKSYGVRVEAPACNITDFQAMSQVLGRLTQDMPPIKGCIQASMVSRDNLFKNMEYDDWKSGSECKTIGSWNLHQILPTGMDFFVLLSSVSNIVGLQGQSNYNVGNSYMEALARYRVAHGEKAVALDLGAMVDDGLLAENPERLRRVLTYGTLYPITRQTFFGILDYYCSPSTPLSTPRQSQVIIGIAHDRGVGLEGLDLEKQPLLRHLLQERNMKAAFGRKEHEDGEDYRQSFSNANSLHDAGNVVIKALLKKLSKTLPSLENNDLVDIHKPIQSSGVDSLLAVELRNWIAKEFRANVAVFETQGASTFSMLGMLVAGRSGLRHVEWTM